MICKPLYELTKDCKSAPEVIKVLMDNRIISSSALQELEIYYEYKRNLIRSGRRFTAVLDTAIKKKVSERKVYRTRAKFREV